MKKPQHPDADVLEASTRDVDARTRRGTDVSAIVGEIADPESVVYVSTQRALRLPGNPTLTQVAALSAMWTDGMIAGYRLRGSRGNETLNALRTLSRKWRAQSRHPQMADRPDEAKIFERCADELLEALHEHLT